MNENRVLIVYNPAAQGGQSNTTFLAYKQFLTGHHVSFFTYETDGILDTENIALTLDQQSFTVISIVGGDGTCNMVINALPHYNTPIHVVPAGSGNDFSKMIYDSVAQESIFSKILNPSSFLAVDVWQCNGKKFLNAFGVGFDGAVAHAMEGKTYWLPSQLKYWLEIGRNIFFYKSQTITVNGTKTTSFLLAAANGQVYGGDFKIAPRADITDASLDIVNVLKVNIWQRLVNLPKLQKGKHLELDIVQYKQLESVKISCQKNLQAQLDGEPFTAKEFDIRHHTKIKVLV